MINKRGCGGLVVGALHFQTEGQWFNPGLCHHVVFLDKKNFAPCCPSPPRCINAYWGQNAGGNLVMD